MLYFWKNVTVKVLNRYERKQKRLFQACGPVWQTGNTKRRRKIFMPHILITDDDPHLRRLVRTYAELRATTAPRLLMAPPLSPHSNKKRVTWSS